MTTPHRGSRRSAHRLTMMVSVCVLALATCAPGLPAARVVDGGASGAARPALQTHTQAVRFDVVPPSGLPGVPPLPVPPEERPGPGASEGADDVTFSPVTVQRPTIRLDGDATPGVDPVAAALAVDGVSFATSVLLGELVVAPDGEDGEVRQVDVAAVDPAGYRLLVPQVTADAVDVWHRIVEGDAAFTHDIGHALQLEHGIDLGGRVPLAASEETLRIGAYASNGAPPLAEAVISRARAAELDFSGERVLLVATAPGADHDLVAAALETATGLDSDVVPAPPTRRAFLTGADSRQAFEPFTYVSLGDGMIQIDRDWVRRNIVSADVPVFRGKVTCHRLMIPQLRGALQEISDRGLAHLIDPSQYGGCWVPRHILFNPNRGLSMHAWGLAIDFNVSTNQFGAVPQLDRRIVEIFEKWGFSWGGNWSTPDGMHFELSALMEGVEG